MKYYSSRHKQRVNKRNQDQIADFILKIAFWLLIVTVAYAVLVIYLSH